MSRRDEPKTVGEQVYIDPTNPKPPGINPESGYDRMLREKAEGLYNTLDSRLISMDSYIGSLHRLIEEPANRVEAIARGNADPMSYSQLMELKSELKFLAINADSFIKFSEMAQGLVDDLLTTQEG